MNRIIRTALISSGCAAALAVASVAPAFAASPAPSPSHTPKTLAQVQAAGEAAIAKRLDSLAHATDRAKDAKGVTDGSRATVLATFSSDTSKLTALKAKIAADTTVDAARADVASVYSTYRVDAVVLPQARIALGSERIGSLVVERLQKAHDRLADRKGVDASKLAQLQKDITAAEHDVSGLAAKALSVTPAAYDANHDALSGARQSFKDAVASVKDARSLVKSLHGTGSGK